MRKGAWLTALLLAGVLFSACATPARPTATPLPTPGPAPQGEIRQVRIERGPTPTAVPGSRPPRSARVNMKQEYWLLEAPRADAQRLPVGLVGPGRPWDAKEEVAGWVRIDAGPFTGWAPASTIDFGS